MEIGSLIWMGVEGLTLSLEEKKAIQKGTISGLILFKRNIESLPQLLELCQEIHSIKPTPLIAMDREGGTVDRLKHLSEYPLWPSPAKLVQVCSLEEIEKTAFYIAQEMKDLGVCVNFAPCVDVPSLFNPLFEGRLWGKTPELVSKKTLAWLKGTKKAGLASCAKHFPGHGGVREDSHLTLPVDQRDFKTLQNFDLLPFQEIIRAGVEMVMTAHVLYPKMDSLKPATLSPFFLQKVLREQMGFSGLIVSDDLDMQALNKLGLSMPEIMAQTMEAGVDVLLKCDPCADWLELMEKIQEALGQNRVDLENFKRNSIKWTKIHQFKQKYSHIKPCASVKSLKKRWPDSITRKWCDKLNRKIEQVQMEK